MAEQVGAAFMTNGRGTAGDSTYGSIVLSPDASCSDLASFLRIGSSNLATDRDPESGGGALMHSLEGLDEEPLASRLCGDEISSPSTLRPPKVPPMAALPGDDASLLDDAPRSAPLCRVRSEAASVLPSMSGDCTNPLLKGKKVGGSRDGGAKLVWEWRFRMLIGMVWGRWVWGHVWVGVTNGPSPPPGAAAGALQDDPAGAAARAALLGLRGVRGGFRG